jgi:hypothetical protein
MATSETALAVKQFESSFQALAERSTALVITDADTCRTGKELKKECTYYIERVGFELDPGIGKAKDLLTHLQNQKKRFVDPAKEIKDSLQNRLDVYAEKERLLAEQERQRKQAEIDAEARRVAEIARVEAERVAAEQRKIAEAQAAEARKLRERELEIQRREGEITKRELEKAKKLEAEIAAKAKAQAALDEAKARELAAAQAEEAARNTPQVVVKPNIPTVAGVKSQVYYFAEVTDPQAIIRAYETAKDPVRIAFLRKFITVNEKEVGVFARETKDCKKCAELLPGVKFTSKG